MYIKKYFILFKKQADMYFRKFCTTKFPSECHQAPVASYIPYLRSWSVAGLLAPILFFTWSQSFLKIFYFKDHQITKHDFFKGYFFIHSFRLQNRGIFIKNVFKDHQIFDWGFFQNFLKDWKEFILRMIKPPFFWKIYFQKTSTTKRGFFKNNIVSKDIFI